MQTQSHPCHTRLQRTTPRAAHAFICQASNLEAPPQPPSADPLLGLSQRPREGNAGRLWKVCSGETSAACPKRRHSTRDDAEPFTAFTYPDSSGRYSVPCEQPPSPRPVPKPRRWFSFHAHTGFLRISSMSALRPAGRAALPS